MNDVVTHEEIGAEITQVTSPEVEAMLKAGVHLGHSKSKNSPAMQPYIYGVRNTISIIDLMKTEEKLAKAMEFVRGIASRGGVILFAGTRPGTRKMVLETALKTNMPYFVERWIGGALTNYKMISKRVEQMEILEKERETGGFDKYTKKERTKKEDEIARLKRFFDGLRKLKRMPDAVFIVDITHDTTAVAEARRMKIPLLALCDTNSNINLIDFPIPSNDHALPAVTYMLQKVAGAIEEGARQQMEKKTE
ncbi:MAG: 30S ribosomal protein S2 [bacterium]|nr:30S ribosomal protein S2 [bacterium]